MDGCRAGWLCVSRDRRQGTCRADIIGTIEEILRFGKPAAAAIDMPIGLTDAGPRQCEREARRLLGRPRSSSVFPVPARPLLSARGYAQACRIGLRVDGRKPSRQSWGIFPKIRDVDDFLRSHEDFQARLWEAHPEVSFRALGGRHAPAHPKKTPEVRRERERLIRSRFGPGLREAQEGLPSGGWGMDDLLDAFAVLWTAQRIADGRAVSLPSHPPVDAFGLRMAIAY